MNRIILHIGLPKTGTTALQSFLYYNENNLNKYGFSYPHISEELSEIPLSREHYRKNGNWFEKLIKHSIPEYLEQLLQSIRRNLDKHNTIISAEDIIYDYEEIIELLEREFSNVSVVVYLRRQDELIESIWNQNIKAGDTSDEFSSFVSNPPQWFCYDLVIEKIIRIVGKENVIVRIYDKEALKNGKIEYDFLEVLGIDSDLEGWNSSVFPNSRLADELIEIRKNFNRVGLQIEGYQSRNFRYVFEQVSSICKSKTNHITYFGLQDRYDFLKRYEICNDTVKQLFFPDREALFRNEKKYPDHNYERRECLDESLLWTIFAFSGIVVELDKRISACEYKIHNMKKEELSVIKLIAGERKICLFGAGNFGKRILKIGSNIINEIYDNNYDKQGRILYGMIIKPATEMKNLCNSFVIIAAEDTYYMEKQIEEYGFVKDVDYIVAKNYIPSVVFDA